MPMRGMFLGRFQPFHNGHLSVLETIREEVDRLLVVVGSSQYSHSFENPFTAGERVWMIEEALKAKDMSASIIPVPDIHRNSLWVSHVETFVPPFEVCYMNNPLPKRLFREAGYEIRTFDLVERDRFEATRIREMMRREDEGWRELVPVEVARVVDEVDGVQRLHDVTCSDSSQALDADFA